MVTGRGSDDMSGSEADSVPTLAEEWDMSDTGGAVRP